MKNIFPNYLHIVFIKLVQVFFKLIKHPPVCPEIPETIENGSAIVVARPRENVNVFGMIVSYKCDQGYFLSTRTSLFVCAENGTWNSEDLNPKCFKSK